MVIWGLQCEGVLEIYSGMAPERPQSTRLDLGVVMPWIYHSVFFLIVFVLCYWFIVDLLFCSYFILYKLLYKFCSGCLLLYLFICYFSQLFLLDFYLSPVVFDFFEFVFFFFDSITLSLRSWRIFVFCWIMADKGAEEEVGCLEIREELLKT